MSQPARKRAQYSDIEALPTGLVGEILAGELYTHPRPRYSHGRASSKLGVLVGCFDRDTGGPSDPGGWVIVDEPELHLGDDVIVPDLAGWKLDRVTWTRDASFLVVAPDWVCEILSPGTETEDRSVKMPAYARHCVPWAWLIDPDERALEVYRLDSGVLRQQLPIYRGRIAVNAQPFEARTIEMWRVWG